MIFFVPLTNVGPQVQFRVTTKLLLCDLNIKTIIVTLKFTLNYLAYCLVSVYYVNITEVQYNLPHIHYEVMGDITLFHLCQIMYRVTDLPLSYLSVKL